MGCDLLILRVIKITRGHIVQARGVSHRPAFIQIVRERPAGISNYFLRERHDVYKIRWRRGG